MTTHVKKACEKASKTVKALIRITANIGGPSQAKRKVFANAALSQLLYSAPIWARTLKYKYYEDLMSRTTRKLALRVISGYRMVSREAAQVLAGIPPIKLLVEERYATFVREKMRSSYWRNGSKNGRSIMDGPLR